MPSKRTVPRICQQCGVDFLAEPRKPPRMAKYCSVGCTQASLRTPVEQLLQSRASEPLGAYGCIEWTGPRLPRGYGVLGGHRYAHRVVWELANGPIPHGMMVRHVICDNPPCILLEHLGLGTHLDNMADMRTHGRSLTGDRNVTRMRNGSVRRGDEHWSRRMPERTPRGEQRREAKLTEIQVREIRARYAAGAIQQKDLAHEYGVSGGCILAIVRGKTWKHLA